MQTVTETEPVVRGQTAAASYKPALLDNGVRLMVPPHISEGERVVDEAPPIRPMSSVPATEGPARGWGNRPPAPCHTMNCYTPMSRRSPLITVMVNAAYKAARDLIRDFGEVENLQVSRKGPADFVSAADHRAEETIVAELRRARPKFGFLLEEGGTIEGEDTSNRWVVDPLDGTTNFLHGLPHFCISIGLERDGKPHAGVIYDPIRDELFWAENGTSAFLNNQRLRVSARRTLPTALLATAFPFIARPRCPNHGAIVHRLSGETSGVRRTGSAALDLAYVAAGRLDGFWGYALAPWDLAAGVAIVREAGGIVTGVTGGADIMSSGDVLVTNGHLHRTLQEALAQTDG